MESIIRRHQLNEMHAVQEATDARMMPVAGFEEASSRSAPAEFPIEHVRMA